MRSTRSSSGGLAGRELVGLQNRDSVTAEVWVPRASLRSALGWLEVPSLGLSIDGAERRLGLGKWKKGMRILELIKAEGVIRCSRACGAPSGL